MSLFTEDLEFYHDTGGLSNRAENAESFKKMFASTPDIRRELEPGTLQVYPIKDYGAMEIGRHRFCFRTLYRRGVEIVAQQLDGFKQSSFFELQADVVPSAGRLQERSGVLNFLGIARPRAGGGELNEPSHGRAIYRLSKETVAETWSAFISVGCTSPLLKKLSR
jgi:hypothetical protein